MKKFFVRFYGLLRMFGFDPRATVTAFRSLPFYYKDLRAIKKQRGSDDTFAFSGNFPQLKERFSDAGKMKGHYFHQDLLVAKRIYKNQPVRHVDIGSRIDGFVAHVSVFREIEILDIRPMESKVNNIKFRQADLMKLPAGMEAYCDSISSLHAIEHFGLGRYGDPIDYDGHLKALDNIHKILKPGGKFYFSSPMGTQRIDFNAHRVFSLPYLLRLFETSYVIEQFSYVDDKGELFENVSFDDQNIKTSFNCHWGCGIFELRKR
jgi:SAM-dependent methyltransferase